MKNTSHGKTEHDKGVYVSLTGPQAEQAMNAFRRQMQQWQVALPPVEPLILDFGLGDFTSTGLIECWIANELRAGYCGKYLFVFDGQSCPMHHHALKHETFFIAQGKVRMTCAGAVRDMSPGDVLAMAPGTVHGFTGIGPALLLEVSTPCRADDNCFQDARIRGGHKN